MHRLINLFIGNAFINWVAYYAWKNEMQFCCKAKASGKYQMCIRSYIEKFVPVTEMDRLSKTRFFNCNIFLLSFHWFLHCFPANQFQAWKYWKNRNCICTNVWLLIGFRLWSTVYRDVIYVSGSDCELNENISKPWKLIQPSLWGVSNTWHKRRSERHEWLVC